MSRGKYPNRRRGAPIWYYPTLIVLIAVFVFSVWNLADYFIGSRQQADAYDALAALVDAARGTTPTIPREEIPGNTADGNFPVGEMPSNTPTTAPTHNEDGILLEYAPLYEMNPDMAGWISIEGTKINYPVMHTPGRTDYYLQRNFEGNYSSWGCIYAREECDLNEPSDNVTLYGHTMNDGSMFAALHGYNSREFWEQHRYIRFDTLAEHHTYEIFAVFITHAAAGKGFGYHNFIDATTEEEFDTFVNTCISLSFYKTGLVPTYGDKIICLSTCEYTLDNGRLVVAAVRID